MSKTPKWLERWNELTKDPATGQPFKFLAIKGWDVWQDKDATTEWCKDWVAKDENPKYFLKPCMQQWMMDRLRRMRVVVGQNLDNNPSGLIAAFRLGSRRGDASVAPRLLLGLVEVQFLVATNEQDRKVKRVYKSRVNNNKTITNNNVVDEAVKREEQDQSTKSSGSPVQPKKDQEAAPAPACNHWPRCANGKGPCAKKTPVSSPVSPKKKILGFDPCSIEPFDDWTAEEICLVACYWWKYAKDTWFRDNVNTADYFRKKFPDMAERFPKGWQPPKPKEKQSEEAKAKADPNCPTCHGKGEYKANKPGYPKGMFFQRVVCACTTEGSISPVQT